MEARPETQRAKARRIAAALAFGALCHLTFAAAGAAMLIGMWFGMSQSFGALSAPWSYLANLALLLQFPLAHSALLTPRGQRVLKALVPGPWGGTLATTTYAFIASLQLLALFTLWTPSGIVWWQAEGVILWAITAVYAFAWGLLAKASFDAGAEVQSGFLGWSSLLRNVRPVLPDMPETGLFRLIRQPIYAAFALTLWTVPTWTPDQLVLAFSYTGYCVLAPRLKERRFERMFGARFEAYRARVPYWIPFTKPPEAKNG